MERNLAAVLALAGTAALSFTLAAIAPADAYADDITIDNTPFASSKTRAEIRADLLSQPALLKMNASELAMQSNYLPPIKSVITRDQAKAEYKASREYVRGLLAEDSGSSYFAKGAASTATMGAAAR